LTLNNSEKELACFRGDSTAGFMFYLDQKGKIEVEQAPEGFLSLGWSRKRVLPKVEGPGRFKVSLVEPRKRTKREETSQADSPRPGDSVGDSVFSAEELRDLQAMESNSMSSQRPFKGQRCFASALKDMAIAAPNNYEQELESQPKFVHRKGQVSVRDRYRRALRNCDLKLLDETEMKSDQFIQLLLNDLDIIDDRQSVPM